MSEEYRNGYRDGFEDGIKYAAKESTPVPASPPVVVPTPVHIDPNICPTCLTDFRIQTQWFICPRSDCPTLSRNVPNGPRSWLDRFVIHNGTTVVTTQAGNSEGNKGKGKT